MTVASCSARRAAIRAMQHGHTHTDAHVLKPE
jgi:hypothetical protein